MIDQAYGAAIIAALEPVKKARTLTEFAHSLRLPDGPSGPRDGQPGDLWIPETEPTQSAFLAAVDSGRWRKFTVVAPSQRGKTLKAIVSTLLHATADCRQSVGFVLPSLDGLAKAWDGKLKPAIEGTGYGGWLPTKGPGSRGGKPPVLTLRDPATDRRAGLIYFMAMGTGGRETAVSQVSPQKIMIDEADDAESAGQIALICKRINSWGKIGRAYIASTVNDRTGRDVTDPQNPDSSHPILILFREGSGHRQHHRCPHCLGYFVPGIEHLDVDQARITCPLCSVIWSESDRREAINNSISAGKNDKISEGKVVQGHYESDDYSELTTVLDYHMTVLTDVCADIRAARIAESRHAYSLMKTVVQKMFCRSYVEPVMEGEISTKLLASRSSNSTSNKRTVPAWVKFVTISQDPGKHVHYWLVMGHGEGDRWCIIDWGYERTVEYIDNKPKREPTDKDHIDVLNLIRDKANTGWQVEGSERRMRPVQRGLDIGYLMTLMVAWLAGEPEWKAVRGLGNNQRDESKGLRPDGDNSHMALAAEISRTNSMKVFRPVGWRQYVFGLVGDTIRHNIHASLLRDPSDVGSGQIPAGLKANDMLILHLCGEVWRSPEVKDGKQIAGYWAHPHGGWDLLDCARYALALAMLHVYHPDFYDSGEVISAPLEEPEPASSWLGDNTRWRL